MSSIALSPISNIKKYILIIIVVHTHIQVIIKHIYRSIKYY